MKEKGGEGRREIKRISLYKDDGDIEDTERERTEREVGVFKGNETNKFDRSVRNEETGRDEGER